VDFLKLGPVRNENRTEDRVLTGITNVHG